MNGTAPGCILRHCLTLRLPTAASEQAALEAVLDELAPAFGDALPPGGERRHALLMLAEDAGSATAVRFWADARATGLPLASPGAFPWCLANAPAGVLARRFAVTGPNFTWLLPQPWDAQALAGPAAWLVSHLSQRDAEDTTPQAWVVMLRFASPGARLALWHAHAGSAAQTGMQALLADWSQRLMFDWHTDLVADDQAPNQR